MQIIISPAKKMRSDPDSLPWQDLPCFLSRAEELYDRLKGMSTAELKALWRCSDAITALNVERLRTTTDLRACLTPAILAYEGIQYQYMAPNVFTEEEFSYIQAHVRILSGLYGVLRPFDGVIPYRLEMQAKLNICEAKNLYEYWGSVIADRIFAESDCVVNLASLEYSLCVSRHQRPGTQLITCVFGEERQGKVVEKGTLCKMARGEMVRYLAQTGADRPEDLKGFSRLGYRYCRERSDPSTYVFLAGTGL